jgi:hypothetical protein
VSLGKVTETLSQTAALKSDLDRRMSLNLLVCDHARASAHLLI